MKIRYSILLVFYVLTTSAQNLVTNPGFEEYSECPSTLGDITKAKGWSEISGSSPDYFNSCYVWSKITGLKLGVPDNFEGYRVPKNGNAYVGISLLSLRNFTYREYVKNELKAKLVKGKIYKVAFYVSLSDSSKFHSNSISFCFTSGAKSKIKPSAKKIDPMEPLVSCPTRVNITTEKLTSKEWVKIEGEYVAQGGEEYLIIGLFLEDMNKKEYQKTIKKYEHLCRSLKCTPYYYIDDVSVEEIKEENLQPRF